MVKQYLVDWTPDQEWAVQDWDRSDAYVVLASDYAALEARCRELEAALRWIANMGPGLPWQKAVDVARAALTVETACEHEWEPTGVTGDNGVLYDCKKCGGKKGWNPGAAVEHWESVPNRTVKP